LTCFALGAPERLRLCPWHVCVLRAGMIGHPGICIDNACEEQYRSAKK
jgi:hypothetical protein